MRVLGIDFGEVRIGIAVSDPEAKMAIPLTTLTRVNDRAAIEEIQQIVEREGVDRIVLGEPRNLDGSLGEAARRVRSFREKLEGQLAIRCDLTDESLTSVEARERLRDAGVDVHRSPERIDQVAAQILLEQYLETLTGEADD
jgi:putative Holliday junction resolvase